MAILTINHIDESLKTKLEKMAAQTGVTIEEQARQILCEAVLSEPQKGKGLGTRIHQRFAKLGGFEFELPVRSKTNT